MSTVKELHAYFEDSMATIRAVKGDAYGDALLFLHKTISIGQAFNAALDPDVPEAARSMINNQYAEVMEFAFAKVIESLNVSEDEENEIWKWQEVFTNRKLGVMNKRRMQ